MSVGMRGRPPPPVSRDQLRRCSWARRSAPCRSAGGRPGRSSLLACDRSRRRSKIPSGSPSGGVSPEPVAASRWSSGVSKTSGRKTSRVSRISSIPARKRPWSAGHAARGSAMSAKTSRRVERSRERLPSGPRRRSRAARASSTSCWVRRRAPDHGLSARLGRQARRVATPVSCATRASLPSASREARSGPVRRTRERGAGRRVPSWTMASWASAIDTPHGARVLCMASVWPSSSRAASAARRPGAERDRSSSGGRWGQRSVTSRGSTSAAGSATWSMRSDRPALSSSSATPSMAVAFSVRRRTLRPRAVVVAIVAAASRAAPVPGGASTKRLSPAATRSSTPCWSAVTSMTAASAVLSGSSRRSIGVRVSSARIGAVSVSCSGPASAATSASASALPKGKEATTIRGVMLRPGRSEHSARSAS